MSGLWGTEGWSTLRLSSVSVSGNLRAFLAAVRLILIVFNPGFMPAGADGHEEGLAVGGLVFQELLD